METQHPETVVEKVTHYVKDMLGIAPADETPEVVAKPEYSDIAPALHFDDAAPEPTSKDAMRLEPGAYTMKSVGELNAESARRQDGEQL